MIEVWGFVAIVGIGAAWDIARRATDHYQALRACHERIDALTRDVEKQHEQMQAVMGKLNALGAATSNRMPRSIAIGRT